MDVVVQLDGVSRRYRSGGGWTTALDRVSLRVCAGSFVAVMGATGSGKSTLLHCAAGLDRPSEGLVRLAGVDITRMRERSLSRLRREFVGFVFQSYNLLSELTVAQNVLLPRRLGGGGRRSVADVLEEVGLSGLDHRPVGELSGGQQQRVAVARSLAADPRVIFADEPTGALDPATGGRILALLRAAVDREGAAVVMVTHDPAVAAVSDRLVLLRAGRLIADDPTPDVATISERLQQVSAEPAHLRVR